MSTTKSKQNRRHTAGKFEKRISLIESALENHIIRIDRNTKCSDQIDKRIESIAERVTSDFNHTCDALKRIESIETYDALSEKRVADIFTRLSAVEKRLGLLSDWSKSANETIYKILYHPETTIHFKSQQPSQGSKPTPSVECLCRLGDTETRDALNKLGFTPETTTPQCSCKTKPFENPDRDWECPNCHVLNSSLRDMCQNCGLITRPGTVVQDDASKCSCKTTQTTVPLPGPWKCPVCGWLHVRSVTSCSCGLSLSFNPPNPKP